jgi:hydroxymethylpyrimidine pyrophosphatase-like HAD family hydrolase
MSRITAISCQPRRVLRAAYVDMDGTLLGRGASLFHDADGQFTMLGARALEACARAQVEVVPYSGRRQSTLLHDARLLGVRSYIFEAGCGMVLDGEVQRLAEDADDAAANALLLERYAGRLEQYDPWQRRESSRLYLGSDVDVAEADELLIEEGLGAFRLVDNGLLHGVGGGGRAYHLVPRAASKARAVGRHMQARGFLAEEVIAVGDSIEDMGAASVVGTFWLVANALPEVHDAARRLENVRVAEAPNGAGVYEAVITELAERRTGS